LKLRGFWGAAKSEAPQSRQASQQRRSRALKAAALTILSGLKGKPLEKNGIKKNTSKSHNYGNPKLLPENKKKQSVTFGKICRLLNVRKLSAWNFSTLLRTHFTR